MERIFKRVVHLLVPLITTLRPHIAVNKTRPEILAIMLAGLARTQTANLACRLGDEPARNDLCQARMHRRLRPESCVKVSDSISPDPISVGSR